MNKQESRQDLARLLQVILGERPDNVTLRMRFAEEGVQVVAPRDLSRLPSAEEIIFEFQGFQHIARRNGDNLGFKFVEDREPLPKTPSNPSQPVSALPASSGLHQLKGVSAADRPSPKEQRLKKIIYDGYTYACLLDYFPGVNLICKDKKLGGIFRNNGEFKNFWFFEKNIFEKEWEAFYDQLSTQAAPKSSESKEEFFKKIEMAQSLVTPAAFAGDLNFRIYSLKTGDTLLEGGFHRGVITLIKNMTSGARFIAKPMKAWRLPLISPQVLRNNLIAEFSLREDQVTLEEGIFELVPDGLSKVKTPGFIKTQNDAEILSNGEEEDDVDHELYLATTAPLKPTNFSAEFIQEKLVGYQYYDFQAIGIHHLVSRTSALLGDDMGLGKTRQALIAADIILSAGDHAKALIVCPASLLINWQREIEMIDPRGTVSIQAWSETAKWILTNYEQLDAMRPHAARFQVMLVDEAHYLKEASAQRTKIAFEIAAKVPHRYLLTGTPILNRETEIHTLLKLSGHPIGQFPLRQFVKEFAGNTEFRVNLNQRIKEWMLRRRKDEVLKTLKGKQEQVQYLCLAPDQQERYQGIALNDRLLPLPKITRLRQELEIIKIEPALEAIQEMQGADKVLIFCEYKETIRVLHKRLTDCGINSVCLTGDTSLKQRQKAVDTFQDENDSVRVFLGTTSAAGVGINLTAANYVIFIGLPWSPQNKAQAEDRAYRNGQLRLVVVKVLLVEDSIDMQVWEMLRFKREISHDIIDPAVAEENAKREFLARFDHKQLFGGLAGSPSAMRVQ